MTVSPILGWETEQMTVVTFFFAVNGFKTNYVHQGEEKREGDFGLPAPVLWSGYGASATYTRQTRVSDPIP